MVDLTFYNLSMTGAEADSGIRVGMDIGALNGIPYSNGNGEILAAIPGEDYGYPLLQGYGPPTADTAASFGQHYYDLSATKPPFEWICIAFSETGGFVWRQHNDAGYFQATYGTTTYQEIIENYNLGKVCIVVDSNNDIFYLGTIDTNLLTFYRTLHNVSSAQDGARFEFENVRVTSSNAWSRYFYYAENAANRTTVINGQSTDTQYPTAKAVYTYGQSIDTAAQGYANASEEAAKDYTDEQLEPVEKAADKAEEYALNAYVTPTASGDIASFDNGAEALPVKSLVVNIEPVQSGSGDPSPENVRPISGWTGVKMQRTGKNLLNYEAWKTTLVHNGTGVFENRGVTLTATANDCFTSFVVGSYSREAIIEVVEGEIITLSWKPVYGGYVYIFGNALVANAVSTQSSNGELTYSVPEGVSFVTFRVGVSLAGNTITYENLQIERGSAVTAYEPYQGDTYDISFPTEAGTVYGGTLDVTNGVLTVDRAKADVTITNGFGNSALSGVPYLDVNANGLKPDSIAISNCYATRIQPNVGVNKTCVAGIYSITIYDSDFTSREQAVSLLQSRGVELIYQLATPITYQLTPQEVSTLQGVNNVYADTGDTEVTYRADPTIIYNKLTAAIISSGGTV